MQRTVAILVGTMVSGSVDKQLVPILLGVEINHTDHAKIRTDGALLVIPIIAGVVGAGDAALVVHDAWPLHRHWCWRSWRWRRAWLGICTYLRLFQELRHWDPGVATWLHKDLVATFDHWNTNSASVANSIERCIHLLSVWIFSKGNVPAIQFILGIYTHASAGACRPQFNASAWRECTNAPWHHWSSSCAAPAAPGGRKIRSAPATASA
jgi:hypothetical protein